MKLKEFVEPIDAIDISSLKDKTLNDLFLMFFVKDIKRLYILKEEKPVFVLTSKEIIKIFLEKKESLNAFDFFNEKEYLKCFDAFMHVIDAYDEMRKNSIIYMPVCENGKFIGDVDFDILIFKIYFVIIKDDLTGVFNKNYFDVLIEEYRNFEKPLGLIFIEVKDLFIYEDLYGVEMREKILKGFAEVLKNSLRKIDFIFRWDNQFRIVTFNNLEGTSKVFSRIQEKLNNLTIDGIHVPFKMCMSHIPQLQTDILSAIESCEEQLFN